MSVAMRFRGIRVLAFLLVLGIIYIFQPDAWSDWLFTVTSVAFAGSLASYFFWSVKGDPARSALGYLMLGDAWRSLLSRPLPSGCIFLTGAR